MMLFYVLRRIAASFQCSCEKHFHNSHLQQVHPKCCIRFIHNMFERMHFIAGFQPPTCCCSMWFVSVQCGAVLHSRHTSYHPSCSVSLCNSVRLHVLVFVNVAVFVVVYSINEYFEIAFLQRSRATLHFFALRVSKNWSNNTLVYRGDSPLNSWN